MARQLEELGQVRGANGMAEGDARFLCERIRLHLIRGSIETARAALEQGWSDHIDELSELPIGRALLNEPLSRVIDNMRLLNLLERHGILAVGQLLRATSGDLQNIPHVGQTSVDFLRNLCIGLRNRAFAG